MAGQAQNSNSLWAEPRSVTCSCGLSSPPLSNWNRGFSAWSKDLRWTSALLPPSPWHGLIPNPDWLPAGTWEGRCWVVLLETVIVLVVLVAQLPKVSVVPLQPFPLWCLKLESSNSWNSCLWCGKWFAGFISEHNKYICGENSSLCIFVSDFGMCQRRRDWESPNELENQDFFLSGFTLQPAVQILLRLLLS